MSPRTLPPETERLAAWRLRQITPLLVAMLALYVGLASLFWLPRLLPIARASIGTLTNRSMSGAVSLAAIGVTLHVLYLGGAWLLWRSPDSRAIRAVIWLGALAAAGVLMWVYPVTSTDIFDYYFRARMATEHGANPYLALPNQFRSDPFVRYVGWPNAPSAYGPLWELLSAGLLSLTGGTLQAGVLAYKLVAIVAYLLCAVLINAILHESRQQVLAMYLWLWSPAALWEIAAVGHNDSLMIATLLLAIWAVQRDWHWLAVLALTAGALIKFLPVIFLPLVVLAWMRQQPTWAQRIRVFSVALVLFLVPTVVLYAPYWDVPSGIAGLSIGEQLRAIWEGRTRTLHNIAVREGFLNASPMALISYVLQSPPSLSRINAMLGSFGLPAADNTDVRGAVSNCATFLLGLGVIWQSWHVWYRQRTLQPAFFGLLLWYILFGSQWFQPWYVLWLLAVFVLRPTATTFAWLAAWALMAQSSYVLQYTVLPNLKISGQSLQAQWYYLLLIYLVPLAVWLFVRYGPLRDRRENKPQPLAAAR